MYIISIIDACVELSKRALEVANRAPESFATTAGCTVLGEKSITPEQAKNNQMTALQSKFTELKEQYDRLCAQSSIEDLNAALIRSNKTIEDLENQKLLLLGKKGWAIERAFSAKASGIKISEKRFMEVQEECECGLKDIDSTLGLRKKFSAQLQALLDNRKNKGTM